MRKIRQVYSVCIFGDLERFDSDSARSLISKVLQLMKEDGSAFASMNPDALSTQLKELFNKINDIEKGLEATLKGDNKIKAFVLSVPQKDDDQCRDKILGDFRISGERFQ